MSDENPFGDPEEGSPFSDPAVQKATTIPPASSSLDDYNPFESHPATLPPERKKPEVSPPSSPPRAFLDDAPPKYTPTSSATSPKRSSYDSTTPVPPSDKIVSNTDRSPFEDSEIRFKEAELERREAVLRRREEEFRREHRTVARVNNFPPLPDRCCVGPCFYQDIDIDIPFEFQKLVRQVYYIWIAYVILLFVNIIGSLAYFITTTSNSENTKSGVTFGVSLLLFVLFTPCSFVCWFRPMYKGFRNDSSISFFIFFFISFFQCVTTVILALGFDGLGSVGFLNGLSLVTGKAASMKAIGTVMIVIGILFGLLTVASVFALIRVHRIYRRTGATFEQAQRDLASSVMRNSAVQQATKDAVSASVQNAMESGAHGVSRTHKY